MIDQTAERIARGRKHPEAANSAAHPWARGRVLSSYLMIVPVRVVQIGFVVVDVQTPPFSVAW
jgi:hypothetical protein